MTRSQRLWIGYGLLALVCAAVALALVLTSDHEDHPLATIFLGEVLGLSFVIAGLLGTTRRPENRTGRILAGVGFAFFAGALSEANASVPFTVGQLVGVLFIATFVHLLVAYPTGTLTTRFERRLVASAYVLSIAFPIAFLLVARGSDICDDCPSNALLVHRSESAMLLVEVIASVAAAAVLATTILLLVRRWRSASAAYRRSLRLVLVTGGAAAAMFLLELPLEPLLPHAADLTLEAATAVAFLGVPFAFAAGLLRGRRASSAVGRLVRDLGPAPAPGRLRDELREVLGDPTLDLGYWVAGHEGPVDIDGNPFRMTDESVGTMVEGDTGRVAVIAHDPALAEDADLLRGVISAASLALENERLHAELTARVAELEDERDFTRLVVDTAPAYFCVVDADGRIVRFNSTLELMTGAVDDARGRPFWEVFAVAADAAAIEAALDRAAQGAAPRPQESCLEAANGTQRVVSWSAVAIPGARNSVPLVLVSGLDLTDQKRHEEELRRLADEQTALRRIATLVAAGAAEVDLVQAVTSEIGRLFDADTANTMRWDGTEIRVIGDWSATGRPSQAGRVYSYGGDTITARVVNSGAPRRVDSVADLETEFARDRWIELNLHASIGAPIVVDGRIWGVVTTSRYRPADPFPPGAEQRLGDFAALVAQAIANSEARREVATLAEEQAALRRVATLVAAGRKQSEVLEAVTKEVGQLFGARSVNLVRWEGVLDEVVVVDGWSDGTEPPIPPRSLYHPEKGSATLQVLETGHSTRTDEASPELGRRSVIAAPVIVNAALWGALNALRPSGDAFPPGAEVRLRSFGDLVAQSIANAQAQEELHASRARIVRAADDARQKLERNLHDGAQQRLVAVSISVRLAAAKLPGAPEEARALLVAASEELTHALNELRELARGIHPAILTDRGLGPALEALAGRAPLPVEVSNELDERLPPPVEAAAYYVVAESLTNIAKYAEASAVEVRVRRRDTVARVEVVDDGIGGADASRGSGLRGLADRVEALEGRLGVESPPEAGTRVWAEIPLGRDEWFTG